MNNGLDIEQFIHLKKSFEKKDKFLHTDNNIEVMKYIKNREYIKLTSYEECMMVYRDQANNA